MNKLEEIKHLSSCEDNGLVVFENNEIIYQSQPMKYENNTLSISNNAKVKVFYILNQNVDLKFEVTCNCELTEVFYDIQGEVEVNQNYDVAENVNLSIINVVINNAKLKRNTNTILKENSYTKVDNLYISSNDIKVNSLFDIVDENCTLDIKNAIVNDSGLTQNYDFDIKHNVKASTSEMITYAISKNSSVLNVNTDGIILKNASNTNLNQKTKGIILDDQSQISANPILEIDEYDVIASHGASIGAIDDEELYYLMSRGLTRQTSEKLIINGLIYPFLNSISDELIKEYVTKNIDNHL